MSNQIEELQNTSKKHIERFAAFGRDLYTKGLKSVATETVDYSKRSIESSKSFVEKLQAVKSFETAIQLQSEFAKTQFDEFIGQMTKIGDIYKNIGKDIFKPAEAAVTEAKETLAH